jgi:hypothetical protein
MSIARKASLLPLLLVLASLRVDGTRSAQNSPEGYLSANNGQVIFIQLAQSRGKLSGEMQIVSLEGRYTKQTKAQSISFSGVINGNEVSLVFRGFLSEKTIVGSLSRSKMSLSLPQPDGKISVITLMRATTRQYNLAVAQLQRQAAIANREIQQANYEKAINSNIDHAFGEISDRVKTLRLRGPFDKEIGSFDKNWKDMQGHAREFRDKLNASPPEINEARYLYSTLSYDRGNIRYDRHSLDYEARAALEQIKSTGQAIEELEKAWSDLQTAITQDKRGAIRRDISQGLVTRIEERVASEIHRVEDLIQKADVEAKEIEKQADDLLIKSKESLDRARN